MSFSSRISSHVLVRGDHTCRAVSLGEEVLLHGSIFSAGGSVAVQQVIVKSFGAAFASADLEVPWRLSEVRLRSRVSFSTRPLAQVQSIPKQALRDRGAGQEQEGWSGTFLRKRRPNRQSPTHRGTDHIGKHHPSISGASRSRGRRSRSGCFRQCLRGRSCGNPVSPGGV
jgi:hypothetical protein